MMLVDELPPEVWERAEHMLEPLRGVPLPDVAGYYVLMVQWSRRKQTRGGILLATESLDEDKFQGRTGVVIGVGSDAYRGDKFHGPWCKIGDWVAWPMADGVGARIEYAGVVLTAIPDDRVVLVGVDPERVT